MKVEYKAELRNIEHGAANVHIERTLEHVITPLLTPVFEAILQNMKDTNKIAFYEAMANFAGYDFDDAQEFLYGEQEND